MATKFSAATPIALSSSAWRKTVLPRPASSMSAAASESAPPDSRTHFRRLLSWASIPRCTCSQWLTPTGAQRRATLSTGSTALVRTFPSLPTRPSTCSLSCWSATNCHAAPPALFWTKPSASYDPADTWPSWRWTPPPRPGRSSSPIRCFAASFGVLNPGWTTTFLSTCLALSRRLASASSGRARTRHGTAHSSQKSSEKVRRKDLTRTKVCNGHTRDFRMCTRCR
mmetsp:Transcript_26777/g.65116  ORF Transcript_26777/g.65116 Transcript_26777/m.65116 type:complete len:226 (+) Transcript_26777:92-769(+)